MGSRGPDPTEMGSRARAREFRLGNDGIDHHSYRVCPADEHDGFLSLRPDILAFLVADAVHCDWRDPSFKGAGRRRTNGRPILDWGWRPFLLQQVELLQFQHLANDWASHCHMDWSVDPDEGYDKKVRD